MHTHNLTAFLRGTTPGSLSRGLASTPNVRFLICTASPDWAGAFAAKRIRSPSGSCNCACRCVHSPRGDSPKRSLHLRRIRRLWLHSVRPRTVRAGFRLCTKWHRLRFLQNYYGPGGWPRTVGHDLKFESTGGKMMLAPHSARRVETRRAE